MIGMGPPGRRPQRARRGEARLARRGGHLPVCPCVNFVLNMSEHQLWYIAALLQKQHLERPHLEAPKGGGVPRAVRQPLGRRPGR